MTREEALRFATESFVKAFEVGNEALIDKHFAQELVCINHTANKKFNLMQLKEKLPRIHAFFQNLESHIDELIYDGDKMGFHVKQKAFYTPDNTHVTMDVMNLYKFSGTKVSEWHIWSTHNPTNVRKRPFSD